MITKRLLSMDRNTNYWDLNFATRDYGALNIFNREPTPTDIFFKPDGTQMYMCGTSRKNINTYNLSTPWQISDATFLSLKRLPSQDLLPQSIYIGDDGHLLYLLGSQQCRVSTYIMSVPWSLNSATFTNSFSVFSQESSPSCLTFKPDGTKMYIGGGDYTSSIYQYNLSTAWDVTSSTYETNYPVPSKPQGIYFKPDGTRMYITIVSSILYYDLSIAWSIYASNITGEFNVSGEEASPTGLFFKGDGKKLFITGSTTSTVWAYNI